MTLESPTLAGRFFTSSATWEDFNFKNKKYYMKTTTKKEIYIRI